MLGKLDFFIYDTSGFNVSVAQLDRVSASDAEGCRFKSRRIHHLYAGFLQNKKKKKIQSNILKGNEFIYKD